MLDTAVRPPVHATFDNAADFAWQHDDVFGRIATRYDFLCDVFSLGIHRLWKRRAAQMIASEHWATLLDAASGTGGVISRLLAHKAVLGRTVVASDISTKMLVIAQRKLAPLGDEVQLRQIDAESMLTVADSSVDAYSMSFGLKICNRGSVLKEAYRVLRPGGRLIILETSNIPWFPLHWAYLAYTFVCMPVFCWLVTRGDSSAFRYLLHGIREFPSAEALAAEIGDHGFQEVTFERLSLGIVAIHTASKPEGNAVPNNALNGTAAPLPREVLKGRLDSGLALGIGRIALRTTKIVDWLGLRRQHWPKMTTIIRAPQRSSKGKGNVSLFTTALYAESRPSST
jgi:ubiquinone/menaquinone biosynthesis methyltransferase